MNAAYELRTSLTIARGHLDMLRRTGFASPELAIALGELDVIEAIGGSLLRIRGEEPEELWPPRTYDRTGEPKRSARVSAKRIESRWPCLNSHLTSS